VSWIKSSNIQLPQATIESIGSVDTLKRIDWKTLVNSSNERNISKEALDLLDRLLVYDPKKRINAENALKHPFFSGIDRPVSFVSQSMQSNE